MIILGSFESASEVTSGLIQTALRHKNFKSYTTYSRLAPKIAEDAVYLSTGEHWNDRQDRESFNPEGSDKLNYGLCFSYAGPESVAMWMLYGGMKKEGVMVDFTDTMIKRMLNVRSVELGNWYGDKFYAEKTLDKKEYEIKLMDVLYVEDLDESTDIYTARLGGTKYKIKRDIINELKFIRKANPWNYEKECRLVLSVDRRLCGGCTSARIQIPGIYEDLSRKERLYMSPNAEKIEAIDKVKFQPSTLKGTIEWNLCYGCEGEELKNRNREELTHA